MSAANNTFVGSNFSASNTVSGIAIGAAFLGRVVVIAFASDAAVPGTTGTINGAPCNIAEHPTNGAVFASAIVPFGTTATLTINGASIVEVLGAWALSGYPSIVPKFIDFNTDTGAGMVITIADNECAVGFTVSATQGPGPTPSFTATLVNNGATFNTNALGPFAGAHPVRDGSVNLGVGGTPTVTVGGLGGTWYIGVAVFGNGGTPPSTPMGQIWMT